MKKLIGFIILLALAGGGTWYYYKYGKPVEKPQIGYATISQGSIIEQVSATGTLEPMKRVDVGSQVSGVVKEMYVDFNHIVKAEAAPGRDRPVAAPGAGGHPGRRISSGRRWTSTTRKCSCSTSSGSTDRTKALFDKQLQNVQQLEQAELNVKLRQAQIDSAKKSLVQAEANLAQAQLNVSYTKIYSPIDGVVVDRKVDKGQTVQSSMTTPSFFVLATDLTSLKLTAGVDESEIGKIKPDMPVTFTVDAYGQQMFTGKVNAVRLNATNNQNVVTYPVWIDVPNPDLRLRPSMTAQVKIIISTAENVVRVPNTAFRFRPNNDIYLALGLEPPAPGAGRRFGGAGDAANGDPNGGGRGRREGGQGANAQTPPAAGTAPATGTPPAAGAPAGRGHRSAGARAPRARAAQGATASGCRAAVSPATGGQGRAPGRATSARAVRAAGRAARASAAAPAWAT